MMKILFFLSTFFFILAASNASPITGPVYDITDFGAIGDGKTLNTHAINRAVEACHKAGGGQVYVPSGTFVSGPIRLLGNVNLHLGIGAHLKGSGDLNDYLVDGIIKGLIYAFEEVNVSITGLGKIDGNSDVFFDFTKKRTYLGFDRASTRQGQRYMDKEVTFFSEGPASYEKRPDMLVVFERCERIKIEDVTFVNSPNWTFRFGDSDGIQVRGIRIYNNLFIPNSDGLHFTTSRNIIISDCEIRGGDDAIAFTGYGEETGVNGRISDVRPDYTTRTVGNTVGRCENVVVTNCIFKSKSAGIRVGYGDNDLRNMTFQNLVIEDTNRGLGVFARDRANIANIKFSDIVIQTRLHEGNWWGKGEPIHISSIKQQVDIPLGTIENVSFSNISATSEAGILIYGSGENSLRNISLKNIDLKVKKGKLSEAWGGNFDLRPALPINKRLFMHDIPGMFIGHAEDVLIQDFQLEWQDSPASFYTHGIEIENSKGVTIINYKGTGATDKHRPIMETKSTNIEIK